MFYNLHADEGISTDDYWDYGMIKGYIDNSIWCPVGGYDLVDHPNIIIFSGRHHKDDIKQINKDISQLDWCLIFVMGDEENDFPIEQLMHPRMSVWVMSPNPDRHRQYFKLGSGWPPQIRNQKLAHNPKQKDWFFSGQNVHKERQECVRILKELPNGEVKETEGFTQGYNHQTYYQKMLEAKIIPCPAGNFTPDTFRIFEALELGCIPTPSAKPSTKGYPDGYWQSIFGEVPFPVISDWNSFPGELNNILKDYPENATRVFAWWQNYKRDQAYEIQDEIYKYTRVRPEAMLKDKITVLIATSPIKSHPSLDIIDQTIDSVRERLPDCEILIMCDGIRKEQEHYRQQYEQYLNKLVWDCNWKHHNVLPIIFDEHHHQAAMTRHTLDKVRTPAILFVEHDTPLEGEIPFEALADIVSEDKLDMIRLHHETRIGEYHQHLMLDPQPIQINDTPIVRTVQWSQRPHVANTDYYRRIMADHFSENSRTMIEDKMHSVAQSNQWDTHRLAIYHNEGNIQHSVTTDGRQDDPKFDMVM